MEVDGEPHEASAGRFADLFLGVTFVPGLSTVVLGHILTQPLRGFDCMSAALRYLLRGFNATRHL